MVNRKFRGRQIEDRERRQPPAQQPLAPNTRPGQVYDNMRHHVPSILVEIIEDEGIPPGNQGTAKVIDVNTDPVEPEFLVAVFNPVGFPRLDTGDKLMVFFCQLPGLGGQVYDARFKHYWVPLVDERLGGGDVTQECVCALLELIEKVWNKTAEIADFEAVAALCNCAGEPEIVECAWCTDSEMPKFWDVRLSGYETVDLTIWDDPAAHKEAVEAWFNATHRIEMGKGGDLVLPSACNGYVEFIYEGNIASFPATQLHRIHVQKTSLVDFRLEYESSVSGGGSGGGTSGADFAVPSGTCTGNYQRGDETGFSPPYGQGLVNYPAFRLDDPEGGLFDVRDVGAVDVVQGAAYPPADGEPHALVNEPIAATSLPIVGQQASGTRRWDKLPTGQAVMYGTADSMLIDGTPRPVTGFESSYARDYEADPVTGIITVKENAVVAINGHITLDQGNNSQNFDMFLGVRVGGTQFGDGDILVAGLSVTSPQGDVRTVNFNFTRLLRPLDPLVGMTFQLLLWTSGSSMGTTTLNVTDFEVLERDSNIL